MRRESSSGDDGEREKTTILSQAAIRKDEGSEERKKGATKRERRHLFTSRAVLEDELSLSFFGTMAQTSAWWGSSMRDDSKESRAASRSTRSLYRHNFDSFPLFARHRKRIHLVSPCPLFWFGAQYAARSSLLQQPLSALCPGEKCTAGLCVVRH